MKIQKYKGLLKDDALNYNATIITGVDRIQYWSTLDPKKQKPLYMQLFDT